MPQHREYVNALEGADAQLRFRFTTDRGAITQFMVQLEVWHAEGWKPVRRYDTAHGTPHLDVMDRRGREISKRWLGDLALSDAFALAEEDFDVNWPRYVALFLGE